MPKGATKALPKGATKALPKGATQALPKGATQALPKEDQIPPVERLKRAGGEADTHPPD